MKSLAAAAMIALVACGAPAPPPAAAPAQSEPAPRVSSGDTVLDTLYVNAGALNVRQSASASAVIVTKLGRNDRVSVLQREGEWSKIRTAGGQTGWVASSFLGSKAAVTTTRASSRPRRAGCQPDAEFHFVKTPTPSFSDSGAHGPVVVDATVDANGNVVATKVVSNKTGDDALAVIAEQEMKSAKFAPPIRNCVPQRFIFTYKRSF